MTGTVDPTPAPAAAPTPAPSAATPAATTPSGTEGGLAAPEAGSPLGVQAPAEGKPEGAAAPEGAKPEGDAKPEGEAAPEWKPVNYEFKLPEGFTMDEATSKAFGELGNELKIPQDKANALMELHTKAVETAVKNVLEANQTAWNETITGWKDTISKDADIGGANQAKVQRTIGVALDEYGSPEARAAFDTTGAGWNPAIIKFVFAMASQLAEAEPTPPGGGAPAGRKGQMSVGDTLYGAPAEPTS